MSGTVFMEWYGIEVFTNSVFVTSQKRTKLKKNKLQLKN